MRLWDYRLLEVLPDRFIIAQWRELVAIKRQWEKGTLKHRLVSYVMDYDKSIFAGYMFDVMAEMNERNIKFQKKYYDEVYEFCKGFTINHYPEHNDRYLIQCICNLEEKHDRGIITDKEWQPIKELAKNSIKEIVFK